MKGRGWEDVDALRTRLRDQGVKYAFPIYTDVHGIPKCKTVPIEHLDRMLQGSELFTEAALDGLGQGPHDDELASTPDPSAEWCVLPWRPEVAWFPGNLEFHGTRWPMCSRTVLCKQIERLDQKAAAMGVPEPGPRREEKQKLELAASDTRIARTQAMGRYDKCRQHMEHELVWFHEELARTMGAALKDLVVAQGASAGQAAHACAGHFEELRAMLRSAPAAFV